MKNKTLKFDGKGRRMMAETGRNQWGREKKDLAGDRGIKREGNNVLEGSRMAGKDELGTPSPFETRGQDKKMEEISGRNGWRRRSCGAAVS